jgi:hypothetical protein
MYIDEFDTNIRDTTSVKLTLFADDTIISISGKNMNDLSSNLDTLYSIITGFVRNRLVINNDKSLAFAPSIEYKYWFSDIILKYGQITYASKIKFLGFWLNHRWKGDFNAENVLGVLSNDLY